MLAMEQYHNSDLANLYIKQYIDDPLAYQGTVFSLLISSGAMLSEDPRTMALQFYAPMFLLLTSCDCHPEREAEALQMIEHHIRKFIKAYGRGK
jgi:hypothetical protein